MFPSVEVPDVEGMASMRFVVEAARYRTDSAGFPRPEVHSAKARQVPPPLRQPFSPEC